MMNYEEGIKRILKEVRELKKEIIDTRNSLGRILAEEIKAEIDNPPFDKSAMDGFAIRYEDSKEEENELKIVGENFAGEVFQGEIREKMAVRVTTGAKIPRGCSAVIKKEDVIEKESIIIVKKKMNYMDNICITGEDYKKGEEFFSVGEKIKASHLALLSSMGKNKVTVYKKPVIGIITTGDELCSLNEDLKEGGIYNCNSYFLYGRLKELGCIPLVIENVLDKEEDIIKGIKSLEKKCDLIVSTGGVSVGEKDLVPKACKELLYSELFHGVNIKPGSPMYVGVKKGVIFFGLSGTPGACATTFELFVRRYIASLLRCKEIDLKEVIGYLKDDYNKKSIKRTFIRVFIRREVVNLIYIKDLNQKPSRIKNLSFSNGLLEIPQNKELKKGDKLVVYMI